jgi:GMP reductase
LINPKRSNLISRSDVTTGYSSNFVNFCKKVRDEYPQLTIFAGNAATGDIVQELLLTAKVDVVKYGIGSGCSTILKTGIGIPQLSECISCSEVANGLNGHIISDGGCALPGGCFYSIWWRCVFCYVRWHVIWT